jgi:hypothetical protein
VGNHDPLAEVELGLCCSVTPLATDGLKSSVVVEVLIRQEAVGDLAKEIV